MRKLNLLFITIGTCITAFTQPSRIDSLLHQLKTAKDTSRVNALTELAKAYYDNDPDTTIAIAQHGATLAEKLGYKKGEANCRFEIADAFFIKGDLPKTLDAHIKVLKARELINDHAGIIQSLSRLNFIYNYWGEFRKGLSYGQKALSLIDNNTPTDLESDVLVNMGNSYLSLKQNDSCYMYATQAFTAAQRSKNPERLGEAFRVLARYYYRIGDLQLSLEHYRRALAHFTTINTLRDVAWTQFSIALMFKALNQPDSMLVYVDRSMAICMATKNPWGIQGNSTLLAQYYEGRNDKEALRYYKMAKQIGDSLINSERTKQLANITYTESLRQQELQAADAKEREERKHNLQYAAIALGVVAFVLVFLLLSHSIIANQRLIKFLGILSLLIVFEFINLFIHPYLDKWTHHSIPIMLGIMVCIAALLIPLHHKLEHWITHKLVEKNNKIRLAAAKKTIAKLEGEKTN